MIVGIIVGIMAVTVIAGFVFVNQPSFGRDDDFPKGTFGSFLGILV